MICLNLKKELLKNNLLEIIFINNTPKDYPSFYLLEEQLNDITKKLDQNKDLTYKIKKVNKKDNDISNQHIAFINDFIYNNGLLLSFNNNNINNNINYGHTNAINENYFLHSESYIHKKKDTKYLLLDNNIINFIKKMNTDYYEHTFLHYKMYMNYDNNKDYNDLFLSSFYEVLQISKKPKNFIKFFLTRHSFSLYLSEYYFYFDNITKKYKINNTKKFNELNTHSVFHKIYDYLIEKNNIEMLTVLFNLGIKKSQKQFVYNDYKKNHSLYSEEIKNLQKSYIHEFLTEENKINYCDVKLFTIESQLLQLNSNIIDLSPKTNLVLFNQNNLNDFIIKYKNDIEKILDIQINFSCKYENKFNILINSNTSINNNIEEIKNKLNLLFKIYENIINLHMNILKKEVLIDHINNKSVFNYEKETFYKQDIKPFIKNIFDKYFLENQLNTKNINTNINIKKSLNKI